MNEAEEVEKWLAEVLAKAPVLDEKQREVVFQILGVTGNKAA